jgi:hypothetical protein
LRTVVRPLRVVRMVAIPVKINFPRFEIYVHSAGT